MRPTTIVLAVWFFTSFAMAQQSQPPAPGPSVSAEQKKAQARQGKQKTARDERGTHKSPLIVQTVPTAKSEAEAAQEAEDREANATAQRWILVFNGILSLFTVVLAVSTIALWRVTRNAANAARDSADAAVNASIPFLYPRAADFGFYPTDRIEEDRTHQPGFRLRFENMGNTPAVLRRVGVRLLLIESDQLPEVAPDLASIPSVESSAAIPPREQGGVRAWAFERLITADEIRRLRGRPTDPPFLRFFIVGYVIYDDFFGMRHTQRFCLKVRQTGFQAVKGGVRYNRVNRDKAPSDEPAGLATEEEAE